MSEINKKKIICPSCASESVTLVKKEKDITVPYGEKHRVTVNEYSCSTCGFTGDFTGDNDGIVDHALTVANQEAVYNILDYFSSKAISMAAIERAFEIPQRTLTKWKNGASPTAAGFALMNVLRTFPWILQVAENKYDPIKSREIHISNAVNDLLVLSAAYQGKVIAEVGHIEKGSSVWCYARFEKGKQGVCEEIPEAALDSQTASYSVKQIVSF